LRPKRGDITFLEFLEKGVRIIDLVMSGHRGLRSFVIRRVVLVVWRDAGGQRCY
jgi:hypothetical protein